MKQIYLLLFTAILCSGTKINAQTNWTGPLTTFTKANNADWTLAANQDQITSNVALTRANNQGLFNIVNENAGGSNGNGPEPSDTEWAFGNISDGVNTLTFTTWGVAHTDNIGGNPPSLVGQDMVVHLITDDIYIDIKFLSWSSGGSGGGFSYERSTNQNLSTNEFTLSNTVKLSPNPASNYITISGLSEAKNYAIYNILGVNIKSGTISNNMDINISKFSDGVYVLKFEGGNTFKFVKK